MMIWWKPSSVEFPGLQSEEADADSGELASNAPKSNVVDTLKTLLIAFPMDKILVLTFADLADGWATSLN
jgi:hypothetical protein